MIFVSKTKKQKEIAFQRMIDECVRNSQKRRNSASNKKWFAEYSKTFASSKKQQITIQINPNSCAKKSIDDSKWKRPDYDDAMYARELYAQKQIDEKRNQIAPAYNKGPYMVITDRSNVTAIYKK